MARLLIESGAEIHDTDIFRADSFSCHTSIWKLSPSHGNFFESPPDPGPDNPKSRALRAALQMGHDELVDLVSGKDQMDIPSLFSPIWPSLVEAVSRCEDGVSITRLLLEKIAGTADEKRRRYLLSRYDQVDCCDVILKIFWEKDKSLTKRARSFNPNVVCDAAFRGNKSLLNTLIEMGANLNCLNIYNETPIMYAAYSGRFDIMKLLLEKGAEPNLKRDSLVKTLSLARNFGSSAMNRKNLVGFKTRKKKEG